MHFLLAVEEIPRTKDKKESQRNLQIITNFLRVESCQWLQFRDKKLIIKRFQDENTGSS